MMNEFKFKNTNRIFDTLKGMQSVRSTFKKEKCMEEFQ